MVTARDINEAFAQKGMHITLPINSNYLVKNMRVLEKDERQGSLRLLLALTFVDDSGKEASDIFLCEGQVERRKEPSVAPVELPLKSTQLPRREKVTFDSESEARDYVGQAVTHLLQDKGYQAAEPGGMDLDLYLVKGERRFFLYFGLCDEKGREKVTKLVELRQKYGSAHDYGLVTLAFQESLGIPLRVQERWLSEKSEYLGVNRIGVYGVDNRDPNSIYAFANYPKDRELSRYFMKLAMRWALVRARYVKSRGAEP